MTLKDLVISRSKFSPLCEGEKLSTEQLAGKKIIITNADIVETTIKGRACVFAVCTVCDEKKNPLGYYQAGQGLTEIISDVLADESYAAEMTKDGLKIILNPTKTLGGNNFTAVDVWE